MKTEKITLLLSVLILLLAAFAAGCGVFIQEPGEPFSFTTLRGDTVMIHGRGLYHYDSVSGAAQLIGNDVVTLVLGLPLLLCSILLAARGSLRGRLLLSGTLGFFLYTYASLAFLTAYNQLFLVYVALFSLSLFDFVLSLTSIDLNSLPAAFSERLPRKTIAAFFFILGVMLLFLWLGGIIIPSLLTGEAPSGLDSYTTLVIQALDLGVIVPASFLAGALLLKRKPFGYLLSTVVLIKGFTMSAALIAMVIGQVLAGLPVPPPQLVFVAFVSLADTALTIVTLSSIREIPGESQQQEVLLPA